MIHYSFHNEKGKTHTYYTLSSISVQEVVVKPDLRRRLSSTCSEEGSCVVREVDYDGDGEDSLYYSSTENLHVMVSSMV